MLKKLIGIFILMLLASSSTTIAFTVFNENEQQNKHSYSDPIPVPLPVNGRWIKTFGGTEDDIGDSVYQTSDGGYIITGSTDSFGLGGHDVWLIKTDAEGNMVWDKTIGGTEDDFGDSVYPTSDGGYIITGYTRSFGAGGQDVWLIKTNADGNIVWAKTFGGTDYDVGYSVQQTSEGGYVVVGYTRSFGAGSQDVWLIKTNIDGDMVWNRTFGGTGYDVGYSVQQTIDRGYIITGFVNSDSASGIYSGDVWLIKTDADGNLVWDKTFGGTQGEVHGDLGYSVQQTSDGGYVVVGSTLSSGAGLQDAWLIKTDIDGNMVWNRTFGGTDNDIGYSVQQINGGGYIITGTTCSDGLYELDVWLIKTDANGDLIWDKILGHDGIGFSVQQTSDGGYIITGVIHNYPGWDVLLIKSDSQGRPRNRAINNPFHDFLADHPKMFFILQKILKCLR